MLMLTAVLAFFSNMGAGEIFILIFALLLLFGAKKIPELMRGVGQGIREFKDASTGIKQELEKSVNEDPDKATK